MKPVAEPTTKRPMIADATTKRTTVTSRPITTRRTTTTEAPSLDEYPEEPASDVDKTCGAGRLFMPHETDCNKYYQCDHGIVHEQR